MDPVLQLLGSAGVAGVMLYLFATDVLQTRKAGDRRVAEVNRLNDQRIAELVKQWSERYNEMRDDRNQWRGLALGTEKRLDVATPTVATAIGAPVPSAVPTEGVP